MSCNENYAILTLENIKYNLWWSRTLRYTDFFLIYIYKNWDQIERQTVLLLLQIIFFIPDLSCREIRLSSALLSHSFKSLNSNLSALNTRRAVLRLWRLIIVYYSYVSPLKWFFKSRFKTIHSPLLKNLFWTTIYRKIFSQLTLILTKILNHYTKHYWPKRIWLS